MLLLTWMIMQAFVIFLFCSLLFLIIVYNNLENSAIAAKQ